MLSSVRKGVIRWKICKQSTKRFHSKLLGLNLKPLNMTSSSKCSSIHRMTMFNPIVMRSTSNSFSTTCNTERYTADLDKCSTDGNWKQALQILEEMHQYDEVLNEKTYGAAIKACQIAKEWDIIMHLYESMKEDSIIADLETIQSVANACAYSNNWSSLEEVQSYASENGYELDISHLEELRPKKKDNSEYLSQYGPDLGKYPEHYIDLINQKKTHQDLSECLTILKTISSQDYPPTASQYAQIISNLLRIGLVPSSVGLLYQMEHAGFTVYEYVYEIALKKAINIKDASSALTLASMMEQNNYELSPQAFSDLTGICFSCNRFQDIHNLRKKLQESGVSPTGYMYFAGALAYERAENWQELIDLIMEAHESNLITNDKVYLSALSALDKTKQYDKIIHFYENLLEPSGKGINPQFLPMLARAAAATKRHDLVDEIVAKIQKANISRDEQLYKNILLALTKSGRKHTLDRILAEMEDYKIPITTSLCQLQVMASNHHRNTSKAVQLLKTIIVTPDTQINASKDFYAAAFRALSKEPSTSENKQLSTSLVTSMKQQSFYPMAFVSSSAIAALAHQDLPQEITNLWRDAPSMHLPSDLTAKCFQTVYNSQKEDGVKSLLRSLRSSLNMNDTETIGHYMDWCFRVKQPSVVVELFTSLVDNKENSCNSNLAVKAIKANYFEKNYEQVIQIYEKLEKNMEYKDLGASYMYISNAYCRLGKAEKAYDTFKKLPHKKILSFNHVLFAYLRDKKNQQIEDMMSKCEEYHVIPDSYTHSILARAAFNNRDYAKVITHLDQIDSDKEVLFCNAIYSMIHLAGTSKDKNLLEGVKVALALLSKRNIGDKTSIKLSATELYTKHRMAEEIFDLIPEIIEEKKEHKLSDNCVLFLVQSCTNPDSNLTSYSDLCYRIWESKNSKKTTFTQLLTSCLLDAHSGKLPDLIDNLSKLNSLGQQPHIYWELYERVLSILANRKDWNALVKIYRLYGNKKCRSSLVHVFRACMYTDSDKYAIRLANEMIKNQNGTFVSSQIQYLCKKATGDRERIQELNRLVIYMLDCGVLLTKVTCDELIKECIQMNLQSELLETFQRMKNSGISFDIKTYEEVMSNSIHDIKAGEEIIDLAIKETKLG